MTLPAPTAARSGVRDVLLAATLFGTTGTAASFAPASALGIGSARLVIGGAGLLAALPALGSSPRRALALWAVPAAAIAGIMTAAYQLTFFAGVSRAGVALGTLTTIGSGPVLVGLLSWWLLRERPSGTWAASTLVCVGGLALLTLDGRSRPTVDVVGIALALLAGLAYAAYTVGAKWCIERGHDSSEVMAAAFSLGGVVLVPVLLWSGVAWLGTAAGLAVALWLGLATVTLAYLLFGRALRVLPAGPVATLVLAEPVVATVLGVVVLGERLGAPGWLGAALVVVGLALQARVSADRGRASAREVTG